MDLKDQKKVQSTKMDKDKTKVYTSSKETEKIKLKVVSTSKETKNCKDVSTAMESERVKVVTTEMETDQVQEPTTVAKNTQSEHTIPSLGEAVIVRKYDPIINVTKKKEIWRLGVLIEDMWTVMKNNIEDQMVLLLRDVKGDLIQATIMQSDIDEWKPKLEVNKTYYMRNFKVVPNDTGFKFTAHKFKLTFLGATRVEAVDLPEVPKMVFKFMDFAEIQAGNFQPDLLIDVIGVIQSIKKCVAPTASKKGQVGFILQDLRDNELDCTLWDSLSVDFINQYNQKTDFGPVVMIMKHARVKEPQGVYPLQLTNVWDGTKLLFDVNIPEIKAFLTSLPKNVSYPSQITASSHFSQFYTQNSGGSQLNPDEVFMQHARVISLADMKRLKSETFCVTAVTTSKVKPSIGGWFFFSCPDCNFKSVNKGDHYECRKGHTTNAPVVKYKLDVEVVDGDETAKFVFWDNTLAEILGQPASVLLENQHKLGITDPTEYPDCFDDFMDRLFAFRVKWQPAWGGQASVLGIKDSQELVNKILEQLPAAESAPQLIVTNDEAEVIIDNTPETQIDVPLQPVTDSQPNQIITSTDIEKFASLDDSMLSTPNVSVSADNEMSSASLKTTGKRSAVKHITTDRTNLDAQFSSTRSGKQIKKEKL